MKTDKIAGHATLNGVVPAFIERAITLLIVTLYRGKYYLTLMLFLVGLVMVYFDLDLIPDVRAKEIAARPKKGAEITYKGDRNNMPREFTLPGNIWGLSQNEKPQLEIQSDDGYQYRDIVPDGERFKRERTHLGSREHLGKKDPDTGKAFHLQIVLIKADYIPNRDMLKKPIACERISERVTFIRRPMLPGEP